MTTPSVQPFRGSYLLPDPARATVADVMHRGILSCPPDTSARELAAVMATHGVHCVVVDGIETDAVSGQRLVWGVASDLDVAGAVAAGEEPSAGRLARSELVTVSPGTPLAEAARMMVEHDTAHLVVVSEASARPVGVVSTLDVARALAWGGGG